MAPPQLPRIEELEFWSTGEKGRMSKGGGTLPVTDTVTIPVEIYEKMVAQSKGLPPTPAPEPVKFGCKPTAFGLFGLFITAMSNAAIDLGFGGATKPNAIIGAYLFIGPIMLLVCSMLEWITGNFFDFVIFGALGTFWLSLATNYLPFMNPAAAYSATGNIEEGLLSPEYNTAKGIYTLCWGLCLFLVVICSMKTNLVTIVLFSILCSSFFTLSAADFQKAAGNYGTANILNKVGSAGTFIVAILIFYILAAVMFNTMEIPIKLPMGNVNAFSIGNRRDNLPHVHDHLDHSGHDHFHSHAHPHEHNHRHRDIEDQWSPRISLPMR